jgi:hypothetical protein
VKNEINYFYRFSRSKSTKNKTMSDSPITTTTTNLTPPIRSIAGEASSFISSNDIDFVEIQLNSIASKRKSRDDSSSSSSSDTSASSDSLASFSVRQNEDDDASSIDDTNPDWTQLQQRLHTLRRLGKSSTQNLE